MSQIVRFIIVKTTPNKGAEVEKLWNTECGPLMRKIPGCLHEELLRCTEEPGEYISISEWRSKDAIKAYLSSPEHQQIKQHTRGLTGMAATVKTYELVAEGSP